ncbi:helix-turn-helix domain-containing protein [Reyranella sp.]|uniref:AraC family transcriptional regulator n=1 Tax=Reyranella sp. TaxID=1929291 RepID=UPI003D133F5F
MDGSQLSPWTSRLALHGFDRRALDYSMLGATVARHMQLGPGQLRASIERLRFNTLAMRVTDFSAAVRATVEPPKDIVTLGFVLRADEPFLIAGRHFGVDMMSVFGPGQATEVRYPAGSRSVTLAMPSAVFARELTSTPVCDALDSADANPQVQASGADVVRLRDIISAMEALAARDPGLWLDGRWTANAERALIEVFFRPLGDPALVTTGSSDRLRTARTIVREVEARLDADPMAIPSMPALCAALRISRRTLERAFHDLLGVSPAQHLRVRSLNAVREALMRCPPEPGIVTRIAIDHGFWHLGRFSLSYRTLFGERPIDTVRRTV